MGFQICASNYIYIYLFSRRFYPKRRTNEEIQAKLKMHEPFKLDSELYTIWSGSIEVYTK